MGWVTQLAAMMGQAVVVVEGKQEATEVAEVEEEEAWAGARSFTSGLRYFKRERGGGGGWVVW